MNVGVMYPNMILTNYLHLLVIVDNAVCTVYNHHCASNCCHCRMEWLG